MRKVVTLSLMVAAVLLLMSLAGSAAIAAGTPQPTLNDLVERAKELDGHAVTVTGEVIGDVMRRGDHGWVNINDGTNAIGIWMPAELLRSVAFAGRYGVRGDRIQVTGTFYRLDLANGGDLDIHAQTLAVIEPGGAVPIPVRRDRVIWAVAQSALAALVGGLWWHRVRSQRGQPVSGGL